MVAVVGVVVANGSDSGGDSDGDGCGDGGGDSWDGWGGDGWGDDGSGGGGEERAGEGCCVAGDGWLTTFSTFGVRETVIATRANLVLLLISKLTSFTLKETLTGSVESMFSGTLNRPLWVFVSEEVPVGVLLGGSVAEDDRVAVCVVPGVPVGVDVGLVVRLLVSVRDVVELQVVVGLHVAVYVGMGVGVGVCVSVRILVAVWVAVGVDVGEGVDMCVGVGVAMGLGMRV